MKPATINSGDLSIDFRRDGSISITHQGGNGAILLSATEFDYICVLRQIQGWPHAPLMATADQLAAVLGTRTPDMGESANSLPPL